MEVQTYLIEEIISEEKLIRFGQITKKELEIIIELLVLKNIQQGRLERKYYTPNKTTYCIRQQQLLYEGIIWRIFEESADEGVSLLLNEHIIYFYFYFSQNMEANLCKGRIDEIMERILVNVRERHKEKNSRLLRSYIRLLKSIIEFYCEPEVKEMGKSRMKIIIWYGESSAEVEADSHDTIGVFRARLARRYGLRYH